MMPSTYYEHSGIAPLGGVLLTAIGAAVVSVILGAIYGFLIFWSPFVYINAFITFGFGAGFATIVGSIGMAGKIRNHGVITVIALLAALLAYYVHWSVWVGRMVDEPYIAAADQLWGYITYFNERGPWSIFGWTPTGVALWGIWGIEAATIIGIGTLTAHGAIDLPFCEATGKWTTEETLDGRFKSIDLGTSIESPSALLHLLQPETDVSPSYTDVTIATAEGSELRCVSLHQVTVTIDKDGKEEVERNPVVKFMIFDRGSFEQLKRMTGSAFAAESPVAMPGPIA